MTFFFSRILLGISFIFHNISYSSTVIRHFRKYIFRDIIPNPSIFF